MISIQINGWYYSLLFLYCSLCDKWQYYLWNLLVIWKCLMVILSDNREWPHLNFSHILRLSFLDIGKYQRGKILKICNHIHTCRFATILFHILYPKTNATQNKYHRTWEDEKKSYKKWVMAIDISGWRKHMSKDFGRLYINRVINRSITHSEGDLCHIKAMGLWTWAQQCLITQRTPPQGEWWVSGRQGVWGDISMWRTRKSTGQLGQMQMPWKTQLEMAASINVNFRLDSSGREDRDMNFIQMQK